MLPVVFVFAKKLTRISLATVLVPAPLGNTRLAYSRTTNSVLRVFLLFFTFSRNLDI